MMVWILPSYTPHKPYKTNLLYHSKVPEGGSAKLVCKSRGYPKPKITWKREDGREIIARNGPHGKTKGKSHFKTFSLHSNKFWE